MPKKPDRVPGKPRLPSDLQTLGDPSTLFVDESTHSEFDLRERALSAWKARTVEFERFSMRKVDLSQVELDGLSLTDGIVADCDLANARLSGCFFSRVVFEGCRLTGADMSGCILHDVLFEECTIDLGHFRFGRFNRVRFDRCGLQGGDMQGVKARASSFVGSNLTGAQLSQAQLAGCVLRGCRADELRGVAALKGVEVSWPDLVDLAPVLAASIGIVVGEGEGHE